MDFEKALEFAVISAWDDLVKPADRNSIHIEYTNVDTILVTSLQVWATYRGYGNRVCDYSTGTNGSKLKGTQFSNAYASETLAETLDLIMLNQSQFTRPAGRDVHGLVQVRVPSKADRASAAEWRHAMLTELVRKAPPLYVQPKLKLGTFTESKTQAN